MDILIQDEGFSDSFSLHEALLYACEDAVEGSGAFAFVSARGAGLFLEDPVFQSMISNGRFRLIVGMDAVTDTAALAKLTQIRNSHPSLQVLAFLNSTPSSLFHPKCSWFRNRRGGVVVVGSGNMTIGGLRKNREIYSVKDVSLGEINKLKRLWDKWLDESASLLKPLNDVAVVEQARKNQLKRRAIREVIEEPVSEEELAQIGPAGDDDYGDWAYPVSSIVLIAEIPRGAGRWNQANFDASTFQSFFGATPGESGQRILLRYVEDGGSLAEIESRPSVSVRSQNYRFELAAAAGKDYPSSGRPIGVFVRVSTRMFIYSLVLPNDSPHRQLDDWLTSHWTGRDDRMKRITTNYSEVSGLMASIGLDRFLVSN